MTQRQKHWRQALSDWGAHITATAPGSTPIRQRPLSDMGAPRPATPGCKQPKFVAMPQAPPQRRGQLWVLSSTPTSQRNERNNCGAMLFRTCGRHPGHHRRRGQPLGLSIHSSVGCCSRALAATLASSTGAARHAKPNRRSGRRRGLWNHGHDLVIPPRSSASHAEARLHRAADGGSPRPHTARSRNLKPLMGSLVWHQGNENLMMRRRCCRRLAPKLTVAEK